MADAGFGHPYAILQPVRSGNTFEETIERLLQAIKNGVFPVGERLPPERDLAEHMGVSRATLRDALADLQRAGVIEVRRGRYGGTYVRSATGGDMVHQGSMTAGERADALRFRQVLEPAAAALAAESQLSDSAREHLWTCLEDVCQAEASTYRPLDSRFHIAVAELAGSASLVAAVAENRATINRMLDEIPRLATNLEHSNDQHREIAEAIVAGEPQRAREVMSDHLEATVSLLRGFLD